MRTGQDGQDALVGWPAIALALLVAAFMALSLLVTATGTARFAASMGYDAIVGYAVGAIFDIAKGVLPAGVLALLARRALGSAVLLGVAWICLLIFSCLATHATVTTAISAIERTGTWKMEVRGNSKVELASIEQQLATLSRPTPPRPAKTLQEALAAERVPPSVWQDSQECSRLQESAYFARACGQVVQLRRELAAAQDYERLASRAAELRKDLAEAPIVTTSDPLPVAFSATLGRVLPLEGTEGVALLLTIVVEIMSSFGLVGIAALYRTRDKHGGAGRTAEGCHTAGSRKGVRREGELHSTQQASLPPVQKQTLPIPSQRVALVERQTLYEPSLNAAPRTLPKPSLSALAIGSQTLPDPPSPRAVAVAVQTLPEPSSEAAAIGCIGRREDASGDTSRAPSNIPWRHSTPEGGSSRREMATGACHVTVFVQQRLRTAKGMSIAAMELRAAYETWCAEQGHVPLSWPRLAAKLKALGYDKWKSCGVIRYRNLIMA